MNVNPRVQAAIEKAAALKMEEQGEPLTEQEISRIYIAQYMQDRKAGQLDDYDPAERAELEKIYQAQQDRLLHYLAKIVSDVKAGNYDDYGDDDPEELKELADDLLTGAKASEIKKILKEQAPKNTNRTRSAAHKAGALSDMPTNLIVPTLAGYQYSLSLHQDKESGAYLQPFRSLDGLRFEKGKMYFEGSLQAISEADLQNLQTKEGIQNIDLPLLGFFYSCVLYEFMKKGGRELKDIVIMQVPELAARMGWQSNLSNDNVAQIVNKAQSFHNIVGVMNVTRKNGKPDKAYYQVLNFEYYDPQNNTIAISSPYMNKIISTIFNLSVRKTKKGEIHKKGNGDPLLLPNHSYMIESSIVKEKNKVAAQNVILIVQTIERAGDSIPHLKASTLIERNEQLQDRLENTKNKRLILQRAFSGTWELLKSKTRLAEYYEGIGITSDFDKLSQATPLSEVDPKDPALIPNVSTLNDLVFYFPHKGKKKEK